MFEHFVAVIRRVLHEVGKSAFIETYDLLSNNQTISNGDDIHFSKQSLHVLGRRYFDSYRGLIAQ